MLFIETAGFKVENKNKGAIKIEIKSNEQKRP